jgi:anti-anti-sigma regulatory factor
MDIQPAKTPSKDLRLHAGDRLDLTNCQHFLRAAYLLRNSMLDHVIIDLRATRQVLDSGLSLLLLLRRYAGERVDRISMVNCSPTVYRRLRQARIPI